MNIFEKYVKSEKKWPNPLEAPEVPPVALLQKWVDGEKLPVGMVKQFSESLACRRAYEKFEILRTLHIGELIDPPGKKDPADDREGGVISPVKGEVWETNAGFRIYNPETGKFHYGWNFSSPDVLITDAGEGPVVRGQVVQYGKVFPELEFPIHREQLKHVIAAVGPSQSADADERLLDKALTLSATADAELECAEAEQEEELQFRTCECGYPGMTGEECPFCGFII